MAQTFCKGVESPRVPESLIWARAVGAEGSGWVVAEAGVESIGF